MGEQKYHIEPNTVQETLVIPLYGKKRCSEQFPHFFTDPSAVALVDRIDYDWSRLPDNFISRFGAVESGMRVLDLAWEIRDYLKSHPRACVVNLGCGLDDLFPRIDNGQCRGFNLDYPDVIAIRNELMPPHERETNLAVDLNDYTWMEQVDYNYDDGIVLVASGVFYYFEVPAAEALFSAMESAFPNGRLAFDTGNAKALKLMLKTYITGADMQLDAFFCLEDPQSMQAFLPRTKISARGYMTGYTKLDKSMPLLYRFMGSFGDKVYALRIVRLDF